MTSFVAKISDNNTPSLALFKSLGYYVECEEPAFNEIHLRYDVPEGGVHLTARYDVLFHGHCQLMEGPAPPQSCPLMRGRQQQAQAHPW